MERHKNLSISHHHDARTGCGKPSWRRSTSPHSTGTYCTRNHRRQTWELDGLDPRFLDEGRGISMTYYYIICCTGIRAENTFQSGDFSEGESFVYTNSGIIPSIVCYVPPTIELLGLNMPPCSNPDGRTHDLSVFKPD